MKRLVLACCFLVPALQLAAQKQTIEAIDRDRAHAMLHTIAHDVRKHYYDPKLHGVDFDSRVREADEKINSAATLGQAFAIIAWALDGLGDSHTYFVPPSRTFRTDYGWDMAIVGDHCYVLRIRPGGDAEAKSLVPGDEILSVNGIPPNRLNFHTVHYLFYILAPKAGLRVVVKGSDGKQRQLDILAKVRTANRFVDLTTLHGSADIFNLVREEENAAHLDRPRCSDVGDVSVCKLPLFNLDEAQVDSLLKTVRRRHSFVLDLRGNPGGSVETLERLLGEFFDHDVTIGQRVGRKEMKPQIAKRQHEIFSGKVVVLVDSQSASAAEIFARVMQLEKRGAVVGDRSSGLVMEGNHIHIQAEPTPSSSTAP